MQDLFFSSYLMYVTVNTSYLTESEPDLTPSKQCVEMYRSGQWRTNGCWNAKYHVCERLPGRYYRGSDTFAENCTKIVKSYRGCS